MSITRFVGAVATAGILAAIALPTAARAADSLQSGGLVIPGSALRVGVSGATGYAGSIQARFASTDIPLYWGDPTHASVLDPPNMNDETAAMFALQIPGPARVYSPMCHCYGGNSLTFTQTSAPVLTGTGTLGNPWTVTSTFDATSTLHVTQTVRHVDGTAEFLASWAIVNAGGVAINNVKAFEAGDLYVNANDNGVGAVSGTAPNRTVQSVATDGTAAELIEQSGAPWSHYFTGANGPFYNSNLASNFTHYADLADTTMQDSGEGSEWFFNLVAGATKTVSVMWRFRSPGPPQAPDVADAPATLTTQTSAAPTFSPHAGDTHIVSYECSLDAGVYAACTSPASYAGLADGSHTFSVRGVNSAGTTGPATTVSWIVETTLPALPENVTAPADSTSTTATIAFTGTAGMSHQCSLDTGDWAPCTSPTTVSGLAAGPHTLRVREVTAAGTTGEALSITWTVLTVDAPRVCVSTRSMRLHWTVPGRTRLRAFDIFVNGRSIATLAGSRRAFTVSLRGRPAQRVLVQIRAKTKSGARFGTTRNYTTCSAKRLPGLLKTLRIKPLPPIAHTRARRGS